MNPKWNPPEGAKIDRRKLIRDVHAAHGPEVAREFEVSLKSVFLRRDYAQYHFAEAQRLVLDQVAQVNLSDDLMSAMKLVLPFDNAVFEDFQSRRFQAEAHLVALLQSLHAIGDTLGHVIYFARGMAAQEKTRLRERDIGLARVLGRLDAGDPLAQLLEDYGTEPVVQQLDDMVNHAKHRAIVVAPVSLDVAGVQDQPLGLQFTQFTRLGSYNPSRRVAPFVEEAFVTQTAYALHACLILVAELALKAE